jgi:hypothetical protein
LFETQAIDRIIKQTYHCLNRNAGSVVERSIKMKENRDETKKTWSTPQLSVYGDVETITTGCDKKLGASDGYTFMGDPIVCRS